MSTTQKKSQVTILVKALPQPSKTYGETVCCAGVTPQREWKRLFPVRFRHLSGEQSFVRWSRVNFSYRRPTRDNRSESCHVYEESIQIVGSMPSRERSNFLSPLLRGSYKDAELLGESLTLIRPRNARFSFSEKSKVDIEDEREAFRSSAKQGSLFDDELAAIEPTPYRFRFKYDDAHGERNSQSGDWEAHAMYWNLAKRYSVAYALERMSFVFNEEYPANGMAFVLGNMARRPQTWQLLGVLRLDESNQGQLF